VSDKYGLLLSQAIEYGEKREYSKAVEFLLKIVSETDSLPEAFLFLGRSYHALGEYYKAVQSFKIYLSFKNNSARGYFFLGRTYHSLGIYLKALKCFKKALEIAPDNPEVLSLTGMTYLKLKKVSAALNYLEQAVFAASENKSIYNAYLNVLYLKGIKDFYTGNSNEAEQIFEFLIKTGKNLPSVLLHLASVKKEKGEITQSLDLYTKVINENPEDHLLKMHIIPLLIQAGRTDEAAKIIFELTSKKIQIDDQYLKEIDIDRIIAIENYSRGKYKNAVFYAKKVLKENNYDNEMHLLMGEAFRVTDNLDKAENHFRLVIKRDESKKEAVYGVILVLWVQERYKELFEELSRGKRHFPSDEIIDYYYALTAGKLYYDPEQTIALLSSEADKNDPDPYLSEALGEQYLRLSKPDIAENYFKKAIELGETLASAYIGLIKTYHLLGKKNKIGGIFRSYLTHFPDDNRIRKYYINHLYMTGNFKKTAKEIEKYATGSDSDETTERLLARCYMNTGDYQKAMILYRQLLRKNPGDEKYLLSYVYCLDKLSETENAISLLVKSRKYFNTNISIELTIGVLSARLGRDEEALNAFKKVLEINDKEWRGYYNISRIYDKQGLTEFALKFKTRAEQLKKST